MAGTPLSFTIELTLLSILISSFSWAETVKLSLHSDLHQEHVPKDKKELVTVPGADIIILAGDIDEGTDSIEYAKSVALNNDAKVILVAGNHEFYNHDLYALQHQLNDAANQTSNVFFWKEISLIWTEFAFLAVHYGLRSTFLKKTCQKAQHTISKGQRKRYTIFTKLLSVTG